MKEMISKIVKWAKKLMLWMMGEKLYNNFHIRYHYLLAKLSRKDILPVYQMGKVGSTTIVRSLKSSPEVIKKMEIYHMHFLTKEGIDFVEKLEENGFGIQRELPSRTKRFLMSERYIGKKIRADRLNRHQTKVISLVREPIGTNLSGFFFNYHWWPEGLRASCESRQPGWKRALLVKFLNSYPHNISLNWFDTEMRMTFDLDVYQNPFAKERGYTIFENEKVKLLVLKLEKLNDCAAMAINEFLGIPNFHLTTANQGAKEWYGDIYNEFLQDVTLPIEYRQKIYSSKYFNHFYNSKELNQFELKYAKTKNEAALN